MKKRESERKRLAERRETWKDWASIPFYSLSLFTQHYRRNLDVKKKCAVVLLSGGLDSATTLAIAKNKGFDVYAMSFRYGQRHGIEIDAAEKVAGHIGVAGHRIVEIDLRVFGGSALTADLDVPKNRPAGDTSNAIPITYVPARNTIFLSYALAWAEVLDCGDIFIGVNAVDYSGYPDCRPQFIAAFEKMANLATKAGVEGKTFTIHAPLIHLTKGEIITRGKALGLDYALTSSCYDPDPEGRACGACDSCLLRQKGFQEAGVTDPTHYQKSITLSRNR